MENIYNIWCSFWKTIPELRQVVSSQAKRSGISSDAALLLTAAYMYPKTDILADEKLKNELLNKSLVEYTDDGLKVNSRGAILAKSFCNALEKA